MTDDDGDIGPDEALAELLTLLVEVFGVGATVAVEERDGVLRGAITGEGAEVLVGEDGSLIDAIGHLAQRVVLRGGEGLRVVVDAAGYRERREGELRAEADRAAALAVAERRAVALPPMPAAERRYVHEHLRERGDVTTHSEGDEPRRRLVVSPPEV